jgi:protein-S-isoprenylcysteine O-methyltransferase Ste14
MLSWILSSLTMFGLSYIWHGIILNDYAILAYPFQIYLVSAAVVYLVIGFLLTRIFIAEFLDRISDKAIPRGLAAGAALGIIVYMVALVVGVTFNSGMELKYLLLDVVWQTAEQCLGGLVVGLVYLLVYEFIPLPMEQEEASDKKDKVQ